MAGRAAWPWPGGWARAPVIFPGDHGGFLGGEYGGMGKPDAFAALLRDVLADAGPRVEYQGGTR